MANDTAPTYDSDKIQAQDGGKNTMAEDRAGGHVVGRAPKELTVTFEDVGIRVHGMGEDFAPTFQSVATDFLWPFGQAKTSTRHILKDITGQVRPGEMLLVLGRPGSGCTSLLKILSNHRDEFLAVEGHVRFGAMNHTQARRFRGQIVMNTEEDMHFPTLKVHEAIDFATRTKLPAGAPSTKSHIDALTTKTLTTLGIQHTRDTIVGNEVVRGVSGGERKRVSLAEVLATQAPVQCWDNSTRGLDASNALDFAKALRASATDERRTVVATLYQAGNAIFDQFDKVLVLVEGREAYYGPRGEAKRYFEELGFECAPGANVSDYVTGVAVPTERKIRPGFEGRVPESPEQFERVYRESDVFRRMVAAMTPSADDKASNGDEEDRLAREVEALTKAADDEKNRTFHFLSRDGSPYQVSLMRQVMACTDRQLRILWGDRFSNVLQILSSLVMALVTGSLFYNIPDDSTSIFTRPGALFFPVQLFAMIKMSEMTASFMGRPILARHKRLAFARPGAIALSSAITDIPVVIIAFSVFNIVFYFMVNFERTASGFFTNWFILVCYTLTFAGLYRMIGAWCRHFGVAAQITGWVTMVYLVYAGYMIPVPEMHPWFRWINYLNPATYAFEAIMARELGHRVLECVEPQYIPYGPGYAHSEFRSCTVVGSEAGSSVIHGDQYMAAQYLAYNGHIWRNVGIIIGFWLFFTLMTAIGYEVNLHQDSGSKILFDKGSSERTQKRLGATDVERAGDQVVSSASSASVDSGVTISSSPTTFTFKNICYHVKHAGSDLQLLRSVSGFVRPGELVALMGSSGAGKTTLMDVLAQRKDVGRIEGSIMANGSPQDVSFQRSTGYCEQNDVHEPTATVYEALVFSARLRQAYSVPDREKLDYVESIMQLLELTPLRDAVIGTPGSGLSIEQRKRLTLATELVARPSLLFLDEPTSGLDGQSAFEICRFMRKLAAAGQTIICTIHQPSATLFEAFDVLLLLGKGGVTTYFGPTGEQSSTVLDYFARHGAACPNDANPAEHIVDVVQGRRGDTVWSDVWEASPEKEAMLVELDRLNTSFANPTPGTATPQDLEKATLPTSEVPTAVRELGPKKSSFDAFATPLTYQLRLVTARQLVALWRNPDYSWNKIGLHISNGLFGGFTFWMIGSGTFDLQLRLMAMFNFVFVAPGCISQLQPLFIRNRDVFEAREKKAMTYHWFAFVGAQLISETPLLVICGTIYFVCWYFTCGFPVEGRVSGQVYLEMILYEFLYTSVGQAIAACSPNAYFAALTNPIVLGAAFINFCGVVKPYVQIPVFWRSWLYWLDPFTYLIQALLTPVAWNVDVECRPSELTTVPLPTNTTCGTYMADFLGNNTGYVVDAQSTDSCEYCAYATGAEYMSQMNIKAEYYGWRGVGITALFCISSYALVFLMMKVRTKATMTAKG